MNIAVIAGDGIGKDVTAKAVKVLSRVGQVFGLRLELEHLPWSADHYLKSCETMPPTSIFLPSSSVNSNIR